MYQNPVIKSIRQILFWLLIILILIFTLFPFYWAVVGSFKSEAEIKTPPASYIPNEIVFNNYWGEFS
jgi:trehalose/maltose transport system permease protein